MKRKGQEEMVGFVLIMVVVAIALLVFLGVTIRSGGSGVVESDSREIYQFLESSMEYTTSCSVTFLPDYSTLGELFEECLSGNNCLDGTKTCDVLNDTLSRILEASWQVGPESNIKAYEFISEYSTNSSSQADEIISLSAGNCTGAIRGASYLSPAFPGKIQSTLRLCS